MRKIWKSIKGFEGLYEVSNTQEVRSKDWLQKHSVTGTFFKKKGRAISIRFGSTWNGYSSVGLSKNGKQVSLLLHRVVAEAFIPNPENKPCVNHKNGIKTDCRPSNLEWVTKSENSKHSFAIGLQDNKGEKHPQSKLKNQDVTKIRDLYDRGISSYKIHKDFYPCISYTTIKDVIAKRIWSHLS